MIRAARLRTALQRLNPAIPSTAIESAVLQLSNPNVPGLLAANRQMHRWLTQGLPITVMKVGEQLGIRLKLIDFDDPRANDWFVVNQLAVQGSKFNRRPEMVVYLNSLMLAALELKNPAEGKVDIWAAYNQLQTSSRYRSGPPTAPPHQSLVSNSVTSREWLDQKIGGTMQEVPCGVSKEPFPHIILSTSSCVHSSNFETANQHCDTVVSIFGPLVMASLINLDIHTISKVCWRFCEFSMTGSWWW